jgi:hypothetical protein
MYKRTAAIITTVVLATLLHAAHAADIDTTKIDVPKALALMDMIGMIDPTRPDFTFTPEKFSKEHSDMVGGFSDSAVKVDKGYYGITGGLNRDITLEFTKPSILATYGGNNTLRIKANSDLLVLVSGGTNEFEIVRPAEATGSVHFVTHLTSTSTFKGGEVMSFDDFWGKYRK